MSRGIALILFSLVLLGLVSFAQRQGPPSPFYDQLRQDGDAPLIPLDARHEFIFEFDAPAAHIRGIWLQHLFTDPKVDVLIQIENRSQGTLLLREHLGQGYQHWARVPASNHRGDRISVTYKVLHSRQAQFPAIVQAVKRSASPPRYPVAIVSHGAAKAADNLYPLFQVRYNHPLRFFLLLWPVVLVAGLLLYRQDAPQNGRLGFAALLALAGAVTSHLIWTQSFELNPALRDPEFHLVHSQILSTWFETANEPAHSRAAQWLAQYPRAHFPLVPSLSAFVSRFGPTPAESSLWIAGISSFAVLILLDYYLIAFLQVRPRSALLVMLLLGTHLIFAQGFLYPSPASTLAMLSLSACATLYLRAHRAFPWPWELLFGLGLLCMALCHSPGIACALCFVGMAVVLDGVRSRGLNLTSQIRALEFYFVPPAVLYALLALAFDWPHSMAVFRNAALSNQHLSTWSHWLPPFAVTVQILLLALAGMRLRDARRIPLLIPACWTIFFLTASALSLEAFRLRSFLPVLPALHLLAAPGLQRMEAERPRFSLTAAFGIAIANLWGIHIVLGQRESLPSWLASFLIW